MIPGDFLKMKIGDIKKINFQNNQKYFQEKKSENNPLKNIGGSNSEDFLNENNLNLSFNNLNNNLNYLSNLKSETNQNKLENMSLQKIGIIFYIK